MRIHILGSAAGGGLPQWNCRCNNCAAVRAGSPDIQSRTQSSVAVSADGRAWFLLNASADVRQQILAFDALGPPESETRGTAIAGCLLTDAEIDHTSGLLQLREGSRFGIFSTPLVHEWLTRYLTIGPVLSDFADRPWTDLPLNEFFDLPLSDGRPSGLRVRAIEIGRDVPRYVPNTNVAEAVGSVIGFQFEETSGSGRLVYAPGVATLCDEVVEASENADCLLIDGTFWNNDEPRLAGITNDTAREMGHIPVSGPEGSLQWLSQLSARHRVYVHINNTNPMLNERGPEHRQVKDSGVQVGMDGDTFDV